MKKIIKKVFLMMVIGAVLFSSVACTSSKVGKGEVDKNEIANIDGTLEELMEKIYKGTGLEFPQTEITKLTKDNQEYFLGTNEIKYDEAIASEPMMSAQAHSIVLLRMSEESDIGDAKDKIKANVDGRKWICVGVEDENIIVDNIGNLLILIMDNNSKAISESFLNLPNQ